MTKENLKGMPLRELEPKLMALGHPAFRARQLFRWVYQRGQNEFENMTDLSKVFRKELSEKFCLASLSVDRAEHSADGTIKYLVMLEDGQKVETVFIPAEDRNTVCISTQVGCKMGCKFCATGYQKFTRNLESWEIVEQCFLPFPRPVTNVVMMGMGEPLDNYDELIKALEILQDPLGVKIGKRHITVSTVGLSPKIEDLAKKGLANIAISLHGTTQEQRSAIMPVSRKHPLEELIVLCQRLKFKGRRRITFEYVLIKGVNDSNEDALRLAALVKNIRCKINLLAYNENPFCSYERPSEKRVLSFQSILLEKNLTATYRKSRGADISAACGQLRTASLNRVSQNAARSLAFSPEP
ncbi:MAG: 23S rRNA (adenine(2503)-C(2))-methyltransferase RlmN [Deltaproteobacteria bacterium]|nr:23S rRNA (adenine(2503)-C(2))-methyltransferase RlmN [Deltaproteobacteria bacterium]